MSVFQDIMMRRLSENAVSKTITTQKSIRGFSMWSNIAVGTQADIIGVQPTYKVSNN